MLNILDVFLQAIRGGGSYAVIRIIKVVNMLVYLGILRRTILCVCPAAYREVMSEVIGVIDGCVNTGNEILAPSLGPATNSSAYFRDK